MKQITDTSTLSLLTFVEGFDPIGERLRANILNIIKAVFWSAPIKWSNLNVILGVL